ncbi:sulfotransferase [Roseovarius salis]|uniref:sulfotransferase family protein n=1 Tax=Roseovarius salis TaxID=3376063 RepID=UPI0037C6CA97
MTLEVISSGFGRTGTKSLKAALERLGYGPCHHMHEVMDNPHQVAHWQTVAAGGSVDWAEVFEGYRSQVDWPGAHVWRDLAAAFPRAKVVHTVRPEQKWWASFDRTIGKLMARYEELPVPPHIRDMLAAWNRLAGEQTFGGVLDNRDMALAAYRRRAEEVRAELPADRLLVFDVAEGWEPLCAFLGVDVPDESFPHHNLRADFWEVLGGEPV